MTLDSDIYEIAGELNKIFVPFLTIKMNPCTVATEPKDTDGDNRWISIVIIPKTIPSKQKFTLTYVKFSSIIVS